MLVARELVPAVPSPVAKVIRHDFGRSILRFSTAGSVDDGKSTLIGRLLHDTKSLFDDQLLAIEDKSTRNGGRGSLSLALVTDGLKAEREQGITIDVAYRYFATPKRYFIMADSPGHEQYTRNMATGASSADLTIVLVDATRGVTTQTRRHAFIASLLGVSHFVVAVNKMDLVNFARDVFQEIEDEFFEFASKLGIKNVKFIPVSALHGDNIVNRSKRIPWYVGQSLLDHLEGVDVEATALVSELRFPVQCVLLENGSYRGVAGQVASGLIRVGDDVTILPSMQRSRVKSIDTYDVKEGRVSRPVAYPPMSISITLEDDIDVCRGDLIVRSGFIPDVTTQFEAFIVWMSERPLLEGAPYIAFHASRETRVFIDKIHYSVNIDKLSRESSAALSLNDIGRISLTSPKPLFLDTYRSNRSTGNFVLIDPTDYSTMGAGMVVDRHDHGLIPEIITRTAKIATLQASTHIHREEGTITRKMREAKTQQAALTIWFTGLSGAGKSSLAKALEVRLFEEGRQVYRLDGDNLRFGLNRDLGFSEEDRIENIRRAAEVSQLFNDAGVSTLCSFISPFIRDRERAREIIGKGRFVEIYVNAPLEVCEVRDPHGLYKKARAGEISSFTGISAPYELPRNPELVIDTSSSSIAECVDLIINYLRTRES